MPGIKTAKNWTVIEAHDALYVKGKKEYVEDRIDLAKRYPLFTTADAHEVVRALGDLSLRKVEGYLRKYYGLEEAKKNGNGHLHVVEEPVVEEIEFEPEPEPVVPVKTVTTIARKVEPVVERVIVEPPEEPVKRRPGRPKKVVAEETNGNGTQPRERVVETKAKEPISTKKTPKKKVEEEPETFDDNLDSLFSDD